MNAIYKVIISMLLISFLAACNQSIRNNVTRFHTLPQPNGETIVIVPMNSANNGSLEFAKYATMVGNELGKYGYRPANGTEADLIVQLDYGIETGPTTVRSTGGFGGFYGPAFYNPAFYGGFGYYGGFYHPWRYSYYRPLGYGGFYDPFGYYSLGAQPRIRSYANFNRKLKMVIRPNRDNAQNLFEGEVKSTGRNQNLHEVMPYMVQAFFANFPGVSGASEVVKIEIPESS